MILQIPLSQCGDAETFAARVAAFCKAKLDHHKTLGEPAPREHDLVEACVRRVPRPSPLSISPPQAGGRCASDAVADDPPPLAQEGREGASEPSEADDYATLAYEIVDDRPSLRARKDALIHQVAEQERALMVGSMAPGKRRLADLRAHEIQQKPEAERSDADREFLADTQARLECEQKIGRHAAELQAAIEDLTERTIEAWQPTPFPSP